MDLHILVGSNQPTRDFPKKWAMCSLVRQLLYLQVFENRIAALRDAWATDVRVFGM
jgi:hypothetical protein